MYILGYPLQALSSVLDTVLFFYTLIIVASALISWLQLDPWHPVVRTLNMLTYPVYYRVRKFLPRMLTFDWTPLAVLLLIMFIREGVLPIVSRFAYTLIGG